MKNNNAQGILFILVGMFIFAIQDTLMKYIIASVALYAVSYTHLTLPTTPYV